MTLLVISFLVIALAALGMAVGAIAGRRPIAAGCARLGGLLDSPSDCEVCGNPCGVQPKDSYRR